MSEPSRRSAWRRLREAAFRVPRDLGRALESLGAGTRRAWKEVRDATPPLTAAPPLPAWGPMGAGDLALRAACAGLPPTGSRVARSCEIPAPREASVAFARRLKEDRTLTSPFVFYSSIKLPEFAGRKASTARELLDGIRAVDGSSIFHHTFHFLYQTQYVIGQPASDFAYWTDVILLDHGLAERLSAVNPVEFSTIRSLRERLLCVIEEHLAERECTARAPDNMDFYFMRANSVVVRTPYTASDLPSFRDALEKISIGSLYHHLFESRMKPGVRLNDFSDWLEDHLGLPALARQVARLDPFFFTLEEIRKRLLAIVQPAV
jgi:hypothetical protein